MSSNNKTNTAAELAFWRMTRERDDGEGIRSVRGRIDEFLSKAADAPEAVPMEEATVACDASHEVHMSIIAGVLEPRATPLHRVGGVALPTEENLALLEAEKMRDSQALLHMFAALVNPSGMSSSKHTIKSGNNNTGETQNEEDAEEGAMNESSSSDDVVYMNASSCSSDSETQPPPKKRLITELS